MELLFLPAHDFGFCKQIAYATIGVSGSDDYQPHLARLPRSHNAWYLVMLSYPVHSLVPEKLQDLLQHNVVPNFPISALWDSHWSWLPSWAWLRSFITLLPIQNVPSLLALCRPAPATRDFPHVRYRRFNL